MSFRDAHFGLRAKFSSVNVRRNRILPHDVRWICFDGASFGNGATLRNLQFLWQQERQVVPVVSFNGCKFGDHLNLEIANVNPTFETIRFDGSIFGDDADLSGSSFGEFAYFESCTFGANTSFRNTAFRFVDFSRCRFGNGAEFVGDEFGRITFKDAVFEGGSDFSNRKFKAFTNFENAKFGAVPLFHNCELHEDTHFDEESFPSKAEGTARASRAYRTLKLAMSQDQAIRDEQFFFRREMREECLDLWRSKGFPKKVRSILYATYGFLSGYGSSVWRPTFAFGALIVGGAGIYASFSHSASIWIPGRDFDLAETVRWLAFSAVSSLPLGGLDDAGRELRKALSFQLSPWLSIVLVFHKVFSLLFLFLIGLALRNLFKMK